MSSLPWYVVTLIAFVGVYALVLLGMIVFGQRRHVRAVAGFIPDAIVLVKRLMGDSRISRGRRWMLAGLLGYLALPFDLVPDFIPVVGQLDDVIVVVLVLRAALRSGGPGLLREHWPGPESSRELMVRTAFGRQAAAAG